MAKADKKPTTKEKKPATAASVQLKIKPVVYPGEFNKALYQRNDHSETGIV
jgi:hypothetical protein